MEALPVSVRELEDGTVLVSDGATSIRLSREKATYVAKKLGDILGYKLTPTSKVVGVYRKSVKTVNVNVVERGTPETYTVEMSLLAVALSAVKELGRGKHKKREVAEAIVRRLAGDSRFRAMAEKYIANGKFEWDRFRKSKKDYSVSVKIPLLVMEKAGVVSDRGSVVEVSEKVEKATALSMV